MSDGRCWVHGGIEEAMDAVEAPEDKAPEPPDEPALESAPEFELEEEIGTEVPDLDLAFELEFEEEPVTEDPEPESTPKSDFEEKAITDEPELELVSDFEVEKETGPKDIEKAVEEAEEVDLSDLAELLIEDAPVDGESDEVDRVTPRDKIPERFFDSDTQEIEPDVKFSVSKAADGKDSRTAAEGKGRLPHRKVAGDDVQAVSRSRPDVSLSDEGKTPFLRQRIGIPVPLLMAVLALAVSALVTGTVLTGGEKVGDAASLNFKALDIISQTVENETAGSLFVISGQVKSSYDHRRSAVRISGTLFTRGNFSKSETVFCGNILSDKELPGSDLEAIMSRLQKKAGDNNENGRIDPGATLPFMIVFSDLPDDLKMLDRYTVEVVGSAGP